MYVPVLGWYALLKVFSSSDASSSVGLEMFGAVDEGKKKVGIGTWGCGCLNGAVRVVVVACVFDTAGGASVWGASMSSSASNSILVTIVS